MAKSSHTPAPLPGLPAEPVDRFVGPLARFMHVEAAGGVVLLACTIVALVAANSPWADAFLAFWKTKVGFSIGSMTVQHSLQHWINDGLMAIFFFVIGLEVKREMVLGELREMRQAALPIAAALGGMVVPAAVYLALQFGQPGQSGWGIPMATDIAFVVGCLAILGPRVPRGMRVMLLSLAIVDDIGAILVIAVGYTDHISLGWLVGGFCGIGAVIGLTRVGVRNTAVYILVGTAVWFAFHESGIHATIAGVILGLITPARSWVSKGLLSDIVDKAGHFLAGDDTDDHPERHGMLRHVERASREAVSPLERLEARLHPWVGFAIMPLFALANAGVHIEWADLGAPVALAVMLGLLIGKPVGIVLASWVAVKSGLARLPEGVGWGTVTAGGFLAGIGFTMALFIAGLAIEGDLLDTAKIGVLAGSVLCAVAGMILFLRTNPISPGRV